MAVQGDERLGPSVVTIPALCGRVADLTLRAVQRERRWIIKKKKDGVYK